MTKAITARQSFQTRLDKHLDRFNRKRPEVEFIWRDPHSDTVGYLVINSIQNGAAAGGTRVHRHVILEEVVSLAKTMEIKLKSNLGVGA